MTAEWYTRDVWRGHVSWLTPAWVGPRTDWDAERWVQQLERAGFRTVIFYSKFHDGFCVWPSSFRPDPPERDFLGEFVTAAHARQMRVVLYYSVSPDRQSAEEHPDWRCVAAPKPASASQEDLGGNAALFPSCCLNNPGYRGFVLGQMREIQERYHSDGWWLDIFWSGGFDAPWGCVCAHCTAGFSRRSGGQSLGQLVGTTEFRLWERDCFHDLLREIRLTMETDRPDGALTYNGAGVLGGLDHRRTAGLLSRPGYRDLEQEVDCLSWEGHTPNPLELDYYCRYLRSSGKPYEITSFASDGTISWTKKTTDLLTLESFTILAHGGICSVGVDPTPAGHIFDEQIDQLQTVADSIRQLAPYLIGTTPEYDVGMFAGPPAVRADSWYDPRATGGWASALTERHVPFTWLYGDADLSRLPVVIIDGGYPLDDGLSARLANYVHEGGTLVVEHNGAGFDKPGGSRNLGELLGVECAGLTGYEAHYVGGLNASLGQGLPHMPVMVPGAAYRVQTTTAEPLGYFVYPMAPRGPSRAIFSFQNPPRQTVSSDPAITVNVFGRGRAIYVACPLGTNAIRKHRNSQIRADPPYMASWPNAWPTQLAANIARFAIGRPLTQSELPPGVGLVLNRQTDRHIVHLLNSYLRPEQFYDARPGVLRLGALLVTLNEERLGPVRRVLLAPQDRELGVQRSGPWLHFEVPELVVHQLIVIDH